MEHSKGKMIVSKGFQRQEDILTAADGMTTEEVLSAIHAWKKTDYLQKLYNAMLAGVLTTAEAVKYIKHGREMKETIKSLVYDKLHELDYGKAKDLLAKLDKEV